MSLLSPAFTRQKLCADFAALRHATLKGVYVAPLPENAQVWSGVLFVRKGPYANAVLRFRLDFPDDYPQRPPVITFQSDVFHPLVTPLTTYTYSTRDFGADPATAADDQKLPPGGLSLRHGFPEWFHSSSAAAAAADGATRSEPATDVVELTSAASPNEQDTPSGTRAPGGPATQPRPPHVVEVLQYLGLVFDSAEVLDDVPLDAAGNNGAWHAWKTFRSKAPTARAATSVARSLDESRDSSKERSTTPVRQQPGGARRPGEWNWQGVWEERVKRCVQASRSEPVLFGGENDDVIQFSKMDVEAVNQISPLQRTESVK